MRRWGFAAIAIMGMIGSAQAAPLELKQVPATTTWLVHVDVDAVRASTLADKAYHQWAEKNDEFREHLSRLCKHLGINPAKDLRSLTLFGSQTEKGVLLVHTTGDQAQLLEPFKKEPDFKKDSYGAHEVYSWTHGKGRRHERSTSVAFWKPTVLVFSQSAGNVKSALDVLDGKSSALAGSTSPLAADATIPEGTILVVRAVGLPETRLPWKSVLARSETLTLIVGEHHGESFLSGRSVMKSPEIAAQVKQVIDGNLAMTRLQHDTDTELLGLIDRIHVTASGKAVDIEFRGPSDDVWTQFQKAAKAWGEKHHHKGPRAPTPDPEKK